MVVVGGHGYNIRMLLRGGIRFIGALAVAVKGCWWSLLPFSSIVAVSGGR